MYTLKQVKNVTEDVIDQHMVIGMNACIMVFGHFPRSFIIIVIIMVTKTFNE